MELEAKATIAMRESFILRFARGVFFFFLDVRKVPLMLGDFLPFIPRVGQPDLWSSRILRHAKPIKGLGVFGGCGGCRHDLTLGS